MHPVCPWAFGDFVAPMADMDPVCECQLPAPVPGRLVCSLYFSCLVLLSLVILASQSVQEVKDLSPSHLWTEVASPAGSSAPTLLYSCLSSFFSF